MATPQEPLVEQGGVFDRIRSMLPSLIPSEKRVATELLDNPENVIGLSTAAVASRTGTSAATVSRACQNLGFKGYQHLRLLIAREMGARSSDSSVADEPGDRGLVRSAFTKSAEALSNAVDSIDFYAFEQAADLIAGANRFLIVANGGSAPVAQDFATQFVASERRCEVPADAVMQRLTASGLRRGDVCLAISGTGFNSLTVAAAREAKSANAVVIGLTAYTRTALADLSDITLIAGATYRWLHDRVGGNVVYSVLLSALHDAVIDRGQDEQQVSDRFIETVARVMDNAADDPTIT